MSNKTGFKPPVKSHKSDIPKKPAKSLTDAEYNEIFNAAIENKSPLIGSSPTSKNATEPVECASLENSQNSQELSKKHFQQRKISSNKPLLLENTSAKTPKSKIGFKSTTLHAAYKILDSQNSTSFSESTNTLTAEFSLLSQPPKHIRHRDKLLWLQERRGTNVYVKCENSDCGKWRMLNITDPVDVPWKWVCQMNEDKKYNDCSIPEVKIPPAIEADLVHNKFTAGSIVWAKLDGFPWWPAMVDDCPDTEQYYWLKDNACDIPIYYNVVFFDEKEVTRSWIAVKDLVSFKHEPHLDKHYDTKLIYKKRLAFAKRQAEEAIDLTIKERLRKFSFLTRWPGEINTPLSSLDDSDEETHKKKKVLSKKRSDRGKKNNDNDDDTDCTERKSRSSVEKQIKKGMKKSFMRSDYEKLEIALNDLKKIEKKRTLSGNNDENTESTNKTNNSELNRSNSGKKDLDSDQTDKEYSSDADSESEDSQDTVKNKKKSKGKPKKPSHPVKTSKNETQNKPVAKQTNDKLKTPKVPKKPVNLDENKKHKINPIKRKQKDENLAPSCDEKKLKTKKKKAFVPPLRNNNSNSSETPDHTEVVKKKSSVETVTAKNIEMVETKTEELIPELQFDISSTDADILMNDMNPLLDTLDVSSNCMDHEISETLVSNDEEKMRLFIEKEDEDSDNSIPFEFE